MRWFPFINLTLAGLIVVILFLTFLLVIPQKEAWTPPQSSAGPKSLPKNEFGGGCLDCIEKGALALKWSEPKMQLPDLRNELQFYGVLQRPDVPSGKILVHLSLSGEEKISAFEVGKPIYLAYRGVRITASDSGRIYGAEVSNGGYAFSDTPSSLWLDVRLERGGALGVTVNMIDEVGERVETPSIHHIVTLQAKEIPRLRSLGWEIDSHRVDSTLLIRQKARWIGQDCFLERHGGEEYAFALGKERIDFLGDDPYSCFICEGDFLSWDGERWEVSKDEETLNRPLMVVKKIEERLISFELWDPEGKGKTLLTLVRSKDLAGFPDLEEEFKFIGAKTWAKFIVESHQERFTLKPHDWLVLTDEGWVSLDSAEKIDGYVDQSLQGPLLILDKLTKQNGKQVLTGHLFNASRSEMEAVEIATSSSGALANSYTLPVPPTLQYNHFDFEDDLE